MPMTSIGKPLWRKSSRFRVSGRIYWWWDLPFGNCCTSRHWTDFNFVCSFSFLSSSVFSAASLGFYLFSPNHSDPVSILILSLRIQHYSTVVVYSMWAPMLAAPRLPGSVTLLHPGSFHTGRMWKELPPRQDVPKGTFSELFLVLDAFIQPKEPPATVPRAKLGHFHCCGQSPAATGSCFCPGCGCKYVLLVQPLTQHFSGNFKKFLTSAEVLFPREGIRESWECHIQRHGGDCLFLWTKCPYEFLLAFCHGNFFLAVLQYLREQPGESLCAFDHFKVSSCSSISICPFVPKESGRAKSLSAAMLCLQMGDPFPLPERETSRVSLHGKNWYLILL